MPQGGVDYRRLAKAGHLHAIDEIGKGDARLGPALKDYSDTLNFNRQSLHWQRAVKWIENIFFSQGRQYVDDILISRLANSNDTGVGDLSIVQEAARNIPKPTNDLLGRYIESNVALLTENRPRPRVTPKSDKDEDETAAELSELTLEYVWESLNMPEKHREIARILLHCGVCWLEVAYDPTKPRTVRVPETTAVTDIQIPAGGGTLAPEFSERQVPVIDKKTGEIKLKDEVEYGDINARIISPFEMHVPATHWWDGDDLGWVMREQFIHIDALKDQYKNPGKNKMGLSRDKGWHIENIDKVKPEQVTSLPLWWWERISELVEGPGPSIYIGSPDYWEGHTILRIFDRKPNPKWPKGRTIITAGDQVIYDSPKDVGARAYDSRWPDRWHPYIRFRWEAQVGSIYGRSLMSKLLPKLKRINSIDTTLIMWRRTVPIATWTAPKGSTVVEDIWSGRPGLVWEFDPRRTNQHKPEPVYPPDYPKSALEERQQQMQEMEAIAGTEEVLRGQRPTGVNSAAMIDVLRKQALASRSSILQGWDESLQIEGSIILQEVIKNVKGNSSFAERLRILAREKESRLSIENFAGADLSDNVQVRVDTASMALVSKEAREAKVIEIMQYLPGLMAVDDIGLRQAMIEELGLKKAIQPSGPDVHRAKKVIALVKQNRFDQVYFLPEDDPYVFHALLVKELKSDGYKDLTPEQQSNIQMLIDIYSQSIKTREAMQMQMQMMMAGAGQQEVTGGEE